MRHEIHKAISRGDYQAVIDLLREKPRRLVQPGVEGQLPLHQAITANQVLIAGALLEAGADPNGRWPAQRAPERPQNDQPALHHAVETDNPEMVQLLIDYGARLGTRDADGDQAIHHAISKSAHGRSRP